tara:strand:+ start:120585 stop:121886 length:1302 start_codon:yes stop_codon:yes gene_type:complete
LNHKKVFIIDTNVLLYHEDAIHGFPESMVVIPMEVLEELDTFKTCDDSRGNSARYINRFLDSLREGGSLDKGVTLNNDQVIIVSSDSDMGFLPSGMVDNVDNRILSLAIHFESKGYTPVVITRDISLRIKCDSLSINAENYSKEKAIVDRKGAYTGVSVVNVSGSVIDEFYSNGHISCEDAGSKFRPNECVVLKAENKKSALAMASVSGGLKKLYAPPNGGLTIQGITPRNKEQRFALELLLNKDVHMVTMTGMAGSGKTLMAIASSLQLMLDNKYDKIIISRPVQSMSKDIGFLPGTKFEKMEPWLQPIFDNFKYVFKNSEHYLDLLIEKKKIEVEALTYIRGRSLPNTIFIVDEAQNITLQEAKAILTRMGENSKLIMIGDLHQIDSPHMDTSSCGLATVVEMFKDFELSGHITLLKGERSKLASHAAKIM